ncbi:TPR-like protein [Apiospora aurea]|uniref:TPR-like protein n=1 Tax=Apiospora aurea TaxID=335848 RepID=A0ABR1Q1C5_9PEZI
MLVNGRTSFVFKRVADKSKLYDPEDRIFRTVVNEMAALRHPSIRDHPNIAELQGLCWDVPVAEDREDNEPIAKAWPVLVFEKSPYGDLSSFATVPLGQALSFDERLDICLDVGRAIADMHSNGEFGQGQYSILPTADATDAHEVSSTNVLIFKDQATDTFTAKAIDFGFSSRYVNDDDVLRLARTPPWDAPEVRKYTEFKPIDARKADVFSFGMLCLWVLFEQNLSSENSIWSQLHPQLETRDAMARLATLKADNKLFLREQLRRFFELSLGIDPNTRPSNLQHLLTCLDPNREAMLEINHLAEYFSPWDCEFSITYAIRALYGVDFRVRSYLTECLKKHSTNGVHCRHASERQNTAFQLAICYLVGFGIAGNGEESRAMLELSGKQDSDLRQEMLSFVNPTFKWARSAIFGELFELGHIAVFDMAGYYREHDLLRDAEQMVRQEIDALRKAVGDRCLYTMDLLHTLCAVLSHQGRPEEAQKLQKKALEKCQRIFGEKHVGTLSFMEILGSTYRIEGQQEQHPATLNAKDVLASIYRDRGRWQDAKDLGLSVVQASRKTFGEEHFATMGSMENLASTYRANGQWDEASRVGEQVLKVSLRVCGDKSPIVLVSMENLVKTYNSQMRLVDAKKMALEAKAACLSILGIEHTVTLSVMSNLAATYQLQGRWAEAEEMGTIVMEGQMAHVGEESPFTQLNMTRLASTYRLQGKWDRAERIEARVLESSRRKYGPEHPDTLVSMNNQAATYRNLKRLEEAEDLSLQAMEASKNLFGVEDPRTLATVGNFALIRRDQGRFEEALALEVQVATLRDKVLGADHPETISAAANLVMTYLSLRRFREAEEMGKRAKVASQRVLSAEHPLTLQRIDNLAWIYESQERWGDAEELEAELVVLRRKVLGATHPDSRNAMGNLIVTYRRQGKWTQADELEVELLAVLDTVDE